MKKLKNSIIIFQVEHKICTVISIDILFKKLYFYNLTNEYYNDLIKF